MLNLGPQERDIILPHRTSPEQCKVHKLRGTPLTLEIIKLKGNGVCERCHERCQAFLSDYGAGYR